MQRRTLVTQLLAMSFAVLACSCGKASIYVPHGPQLVSPMRWDGPTIPAFGPEPGGDYYRYAPSLVQTAAGVRHIYMCGNSVSGVVHDHVVHRLATLDASGVWSVGPEQIVFGPTNEDAPPSTPPVPGCGSFDCFNTCDPNLLAGHFHYDGVAYSYALFYTADSGGQSSHRGIGVALGNDPAGPFVRLSQPLIPYDCGDAAPFSSGILQPSAVGLDGSGRLQWFTRNECAAASPPFVRPARYEVDLSDFDDSRPPTVSGPTYITQAGLLGYGGSADESVINGDWMYDGARDRFYVVRHQHPMPKPVAGMMGHAVPYAVQVATIEGATVRAGDGSGAWQPLGNIAPGDDGGNSWVTGFARNHNAGFVRDPLGNLVEPDAIEVGYTTCQVERALFGRTIFTVRATVPPNGSEAVRALSRWLPGNSHAPSAITAAGTALGAVCSGLRMSSWPAVRTCLSRVTGLVGSLSP